MADDKKQPSKLQRHFQEFSLDDTPAPATPPAAKPALPEPAKTELKPEDMKFKRFTGDEAAEEEAEERWYEEQEEEAQQERTFEAAKSFLPRRKAIRRALDEISNLEMHAVIAAGIIEEHFRGKLPDSDVDVMTIAALALNADNFDDIFDDLPEDSVGIVDEMRRAQDELDDHERLLQLAGMEDISRNVFLAFAAADLQMTLHEMAEEDDPGPTKDDHDMLGEAIVAAGDGINRSLLRRVTNLFNDVASITDNPTRLKVSRDNKVTSQPFPDIIAEKLPKPEDPKGGSHKGKKGPKP